MSFLIVDDSQVVRSILLHTLHMSGFKDVIECADGVSALKAYKTSPSCIRFCVFDINMPLMDGIALTREIRKLDRNVPIVMLTTESSQNKMQEARDAGANGWIIKPFSAPQFIALIHSMTK